MDERGEHEFLNLLCEGDRKLENIKFFPGTAKGLRPEDMKQEAFRILCEIAKEDVANEPPLTHMKKASIQEFISAI